MAQKYTSADTSINVVNKVYKQCAFNEGSTILDYGGGRYDKNKDYMMEEYNSLVMVYDKYNREDKHNEKVLKACADASPDYIVCSNVLNVIMEESVIDGILKHISELAGSETVIYIAIYEGDKSGVGKETVKGWQRNEKTVKYSEMIGKYFDFERHGTIFHARKFA